MVLPQSRATAALRLDASQVAAQASAVTGHVFIPAVTAHAAFGGQCPCIRSMPQFVPSCNDVYGLVSKPLWHSWQPLYDGNAHTVLPKSTSSTAASGAVNVVCQRPGVIKKNARNNCLGLIDTLGEITCLNLSWLGLPSSMSQLGGYMHSLSKERKTFVLAKSCENRNLSSCPSTTSILRVG